MEWILPITTNFDTKVKKQKHNYSESVECENIHFIWYSYSVYIVAIRECVVEGCIAGGLIALCLFQLLITIFIYIYKFIGR